MHQTTTERISQAEQLCNNRRVRFTEQRRTVFTLISNAEKPLSAYDILEKMPTSARQPAPPTVYRALEFLLEQGLIHKLESQHTYIGCNHPEEDHHGQFFICTDCGETTEIEDKQMTHTMQTAQQDMGFQINKPVVEMLGTCQQCSPQGNI